MFTTKRIGVCENKQKVHKKWSAHYVNKTKGVKAMSRYFYTEEEAINQREEWETKYGIPRVGKKSKGEADENI